jgi:HK97 gp10 family phage protein
LAKVQIKMPDEFLGKISKLGKHTDEITAKALRSGAEVVLDKFQANLSNSIGTGTKYESRSTGELERSLGITEVKIGRDGNPDIKVGFAEPRSDGESNAKIANIIEYGKHNQPARPFLKPTKSSTRKSCTAAMIKTFEEEIKKL